MFRKSITYFVLFYAAAAILYIFALACVNWAEAAGRLWTAVHAATVLLLAGVSFALYRTGAWVKLASKTWAPAIAVAAGVLVRLAAICVFRNIEPNSDFRGYVNCAEGFLSGRVDGAYISIFPHFAGYPLLLAAVMKITGLRMGAIWLLNLALECGCMILLYQIAYRWRGVNGDAGEDRDRAAALIAPVLYAFLPSHVLYSVVPCTELPFGFFMLLSIYFAFSAFYSGGSAARSAALYAAAGVSLAAANMIRPFGVIMLAAAALVIFLCPIRRKCLSLVAPVVYVLCVFFIAALLSGLTGRSPSSMPVGWNLYDGISLRGNGMWNPEDEKLFKEQLAKVQAHEITANELHGFFLNKSAERLRAQGPATLRLLYNKPYHMWRGDSVPISYINGMLAAAGLGNINDDKLELARGATDGYYFFLLALLIFVMPRQWRRADSVDLLFAAIFCGLFTIHLVLEASERYHYFGVVAFVFLASRLAGRRAARSS